MNSMNWMTTGRKKTLLIGTVVGAVALIVSVFFVVSIGTGPDTAETAHSSETAAQEGDGGMDMQMDESGGIQMDGAVRVSPAELRTFGVTFGKAEVRPLERTIRAVGMIGFDETRMTYVAPKFGGWVEELHVDFTGRAVRRGEPLFEVYSPELVTAQEELLLAARMRKELGESRVEGVSEGADDLLGSARRRLLYWDVSEAQIDEILETGRVRKMLTMHAPVGGIVMEKDVVEGQEYRPGRNLYMIADLSRVWVNAEIYEGDLALVREGMPASVTVQALPGERFEGRVEYVYPTLDDRTRSMRARLSIPNPRGILKPGMYATVRAPARFDPTLTVPTSAVLQTGERAVAFVATGESRLTPRELSLGRRGDTYVQVLDGVEAGERVVTSAQFLLDSESNLAEVMRAMMSEMNMSDMEGMDMDMEGMDMEGGMDGMEGMEMDAAPDTTEEG